MYGVCAFDETLSQEKLLTEAAMMIPDTKTRLTTAVGELQAYMVW